MEAQSWMTLIIRLLQNDELPRDNNEAQRTKAKATRFCITDGKLYRGFFSGPYLLYITNVEVEYVFAKLYERECSNHSGAEVWHIVYLPPGIIG